MWNDVGGCSLVDVNPPSIVVVGYFGPLQLSLRVQIERLNSEKRGEQATGLFSIASRSLRKGGQVLSDVVIYRS